MRKIILSLLASTLLLPYPSVYAQERAKEIESQIESLQKELDEFNQNGSSEEQDIDKSDWGKRSSPVPLGEFFEVVDREYGDDGSFNVRLNFRIVNIARGEEAYEFLMSENQFNKPAPDGLEWAIFDLEAEYLHGSEDYPYSPRIRFDIFDSSGKQVDQSDYGTLSTNFRDTDIFPGVTHSGEQAYLVPEGEDFLISTNLDKLYFFNMK